MAKIQTWIFAGGVAVASGLAGSAAVRFATMPRPGLHQMVPAGLDQPPVEERTTGPPTTRRSLARIAKATRDAIVARNVFCPTCSPAQTEADVRGGPSRPVVPGAIASVLPLELVGTMEGESPSPSYATVYDTEAGVIGLYAAAEALRSDVTVERIERGLIYVRHGQQLEYLVVGASAPKPVASVAPEEMPRPGQRHPGIAGAAEAINCPTESLCLVERQFVEHLLANPRGLLKQARVVPEQLDGGRSGYAMYGIRRPTLLRMLGFNNGDVITAINGFELGLMDDLMKMYGQLRHASRLQVEFVRKGEHKTKEVQIQ